MTKHRSFKQRFLAPLAGFLALAFGASNASAEFVCNAMHFPGSGSTGTDGYVYVSMYSQPNCAGSFVHSGFLCSAGATHFGCASSTSFRYNVPGLMAHLRSMQSAAAADQRIEVTTVGCVGGTSGCFGYIYYYSN